jgi:hypothetical protein
LMANTLETNKVYTYIYIKPPNPKNFETLFALN